MVMKCQYIQLKYNNRKYFTLGGFWSWKANTYDQATITENISLWEGVWSSKANTYNKATITENISLWEGVWSWKANTYYRVGASCSELGSELEQAGSKLNQWEQAHKIFHSGRVFVSWKANTYNKATITENISLWEGVWAWKSNTYDQATITENISLWEGVWSLKFKPYDQATITENISLWEGVVVMKGQYIQ